ncbi:TPA: ABC transporter permease [Candidatus Poribacteria bacterium]|nr:ABC transporter permease [Candidatus Poribacteria bacterium]
MIFGANGVRLGDVIAWIWRSSAYWNILIAILIGIVIYLLWLASRQEYWRNAARQVRSNRIAMVSLFILLIYITIGLLDSIRWRDASVGTDGRLMRNEDGAIIYEPRALSLLDRISKPLLERTEKTYSAPLATRLYSKETMTLPNGRIVRDYPRLRYGGARLETGESVWVDISRRISMGLLVGLVAGLAVGGAVYSISRRFANAGDATNRKTFNSQFLKRAFFWGGITLVSVGGFAIIAFLASEYRLLGTDKVGDDVFYRALKGVRTGLIIGGFTTIIAIPFAIFFGVIAGYFGGRIDDIVQYLYSTLASIPSILLIAAFMLLFGRGLFNLCLIMGITSWTGLCRLLRGETLKLRELEYVQAAEAFGISRAKIILRHIVPNVMHIVLISFILRFSGLVLAEALLSYLQIGVDPTTGSWGNMINTARMELAREPVVWWNLAAAFIFMFGLVLPANLFGDAVRDALDPRLRTE